MLENLLTTVKTRRYTCAVKTFWDTLSDADKEIFMSALSDPSISHNALSNALKAQANTRLADTSIAKHRRGLCQCSKI